MLKIVLYAYSRGMVSSREIEAACAQNVVMMALSANSRPHFTTIAAFIRDLAGVIDDIFADALLYCDELGLIGREMFAVDGCKYSSNASKEWSGTRSDFAKKRDKFRSLARQLIKKHRAADKGEQREPIPGMRARREKAIKDLKNKAAKIDAWLRENPQDRKGSRGCPIKSSITDPDSAKMASSRGVLQGYNGVAVVDSKHQVIVGARAYGKAHEAALLEALIDEVRDTFRTLGDQDVYRKAKLTADTGFHSEESSRALFERGIDAYVPDKGFRKRDPAFHSAQRHKSRKALIGRSQKENRFFQASDFILNPDNGKLICPAGKELYVKDRNFKTRNGYFGTQYMAKKTDCRSCTLRDRCLRRSASPARTVHKFHKRELSSTGTSYSWKMIQKIDTALGRSLYAMRMAIVEPVFANLRHMIGLDRFTLRGSPKVNVQWRLFALIHNIHKAHRFGCAAPG